jgi:hypothetical protein
VVLYAIGDSGSSLSRSAIEGPNAKVRMSFVVIKKKIPLK